MFGNDRVLNTLFKHKNGLHCRSVTWLQNFGLPDWIAWKANFGSVPEGTETIRRMTSSSEYVVSEAACQNPKKMNFWILVPENVSQQQSEVTFIIAWYTYLPECQPNLSFGYSLSTPFRRLAQKSEPPTDRVTLVFLKKNLAFGLRENLNVTVSFAQNIAVLNFVWLALAATDIPGLFCAEIPDNSGERQKHFSENWTALFSTVSLPHQLLSLRRCTVCLSVLVTAKRKKALVSKG